MPSITHWGRLEPRCRTDEFDRGLRAEVRDPLWLLARQWQFGEFDGDDAGSPVVAELAYGVDPIDSYRATAGGPSIPVDLGAESLEARAEGEPVALDLRTRVQAGLRFARLMRLRQLGDLLPAFMTSAPLSEAGPGTVIDEPSRRFALAVGGTVVDGGAILEAAWRGDKVWELPRPGEVPRGDRQTIDDVASGLLDWFERTYGPVPTSAWNPAQLEYEFGVTTSGSPDPSPTLTAPQYPGGRLDWFDTDLASVPARSGESRSARFLPSPVQFHGMPSSRWWEFEDGQTDFGSLTLNTTDLASLLLAEFALIYSDDWFLTPLPVQTGSLVTVTDLIVTDTFGERTRIPPASGDGFAMFRLSSAQVADGARRADIFFAAPATCASLEGGPIEEVVLFRDEMANLAWGVEQTLSSGLGEPVSGFDAYQRDLRADPPDPSDPAAPAGLRYRLMTDVAQNWLPFQAVLDQGQTRSRALELTPFLRETTGSMLVEVEPKGQILRPPEQPYRLNEDALPRTARSVTRAFQRVRTADGGTRIWLSRRRRAIRAPGASGLEFDALEGDAGAAALR